MDMLDMGKYGPYVWSCMALTVAVFVGNEWLARRRQNRILRELTVRARAREGQL